MGKKKSQMNERQRIDLASKTQDTVLPILAAVRKHKSSSGVSLKTPYDLVTIYAGDKKTASRYREIIGKSKGDLASATNARRLEVSSKSAPPSAITVGKMSIECQSRAKFR